MTPARRRHRDFTFPDREQPAALRLALPAQENKTSTVPGIPGAKTIATYSSH